MRREKQRRAGAADAVELAQRGAPVLAAGDLHQAVEHEKRAAEGRVTYGVTIPQGRRVGVQEGNAGGAVGAALEDEALRLVHEAVRWR